LLSSTKRAGKIAREVLAIGRKNIPIVRDLAEALKYKPKVLIIDIAPPGGQLTETWKRIVEKAIRSKLDTVSGLHFFLGDQPRFVSLAKKYRTKFYDVRKPPKDLSILTGKARDLKLPVVAVLSTDATAGKNVAIVELMREAKKRGYEPGFVATGQRTITLRCDAGAVIDAIPGDFNSGQTEKMVVGAAAMRKDIIFVEGQASLSHPTYGQESPSILYGSWPDAIVPVHDPFRKSRDGFPRFTVPEPNDEIRIIETVCPKTKVVAVAINGDQKPDEEVKAAMKRVADETNLPTTDAVRFGVSELFDVLMRRLESVGKPLPVK